MKHTDILPQDKISKYKNELVESAKETALLFKKQEIVAQEIRAVRARLAASSQSSSSSSSSSASSSSHDQAEDVDKLVDQTSKKVRDDIKRIDTDNNEHVRNIKMKLNIGKKRSRDDEELEVVEQEVTENTFKCPFSTLQFKKPMKNNACPHRVDKSSLDQMLKQKNEVKCPVGGCSKTWKRGNFMEDKELLMEMNRFFKNIAPSQQELSQTAAIDLGDDEEEYTLVK